MPVAVIRKDRLLLLLGSLQGIQVTDLQCCLAKGRLLETDDQDRAKWIMASTDLREWLNSSKSRVFLINGNGDGDETFGPTTFVCAKLLESLGDIDPMITLHFFCSLHTTNKDGFRDNAVGLIKSLLAQLVLCSEDWDFGFLGKDGLKRLEEGDLDAYCKLFRDLIEQLPPMTLIFLMIDGITVYERSMRREGFLKVIKELTDMMADCRQLVVKLLLTCHGRSAFVKLDRKNVLTLPSIVEGNSQGWSEHSWKRGVGKDVKELGNSSVEVGL